MKTKLIFLFLFLISNCFGQDNRPFAFISTSGFSARQAEVRAHNIAYMNNLEVISYHTTTSGGSWISVVKVVKK